MKQLWQLYSLLSPDVILDIPAVKFPKLPLSVDFNFWNICTLDHAYRMFRFVMGITFIILQLYWSCKYNFGTMSSKSLWLEVVYFWFQVLLHATWCILLIFLGSAYIISGISGSLFHRLEDTKQSRYRNESGEAQLFVKPVYAP